MFLKETYRHGSATRGPSATLWARRAGMREGVEEEEKRQDEEREDKKGGDNSRREVMKSSCLDNWLVHKWLKEVKEGWEILRGRGGDERVRSPCVLDVPVLLAVHFPRFGLPRPVLAGSQSGKFG